MSKHSNLKKVLSAVLALMMVLGTLVVVPMTASAAEPTVEAWDGKTYDYTPFSAAGTKDDPYEISTGAQLAALALLTNGLDESGNQTKANTYYVGTEGNEKYFVLTDDINMGGKAIPSIRFGYILSTNMWDANGGSYIIFDGDNHTIYNYKNNSETKAPKTVLSGAWKSGEASRGLFGELGQNCTVKNLHFVGANVENTASGGWKGAGLVVGRSASVGVTISNVTVDATSKLSGPAKTGLIADVFDATTATDSTPGMTVEYCVNEATITTEGARVGGVIGCLSTNVPLTIDHCVFGGTITVPKTLHGGNSMGGILSSVFKASITTPEITIQNCLNTGTFTAAANLTPSMGGIWNEVASDIVNTNNNLNIINCYDYSVRTMANTSKNAAFSNVAKIAVSADSYAIAQAGFTYANATNVKTGGDLITVSEGVVSTLPTMVKAAQTEIATATGYVFAKDITDAKWDGKALDYYWYLSAAGTEEDPYQISNGAELAAWSTLTNNTHAVNLGKIVAGTVAVFNNVYVELTGDIDMGGNAMQPIRHGISNGSTFLAGYEDGLHFDGQDHTIANLLVNGKPAAVAVSGTTQTTCAHGLFAGIGSNSIVKDINIVGMTVTCPCGGWASTSFLAGYVSGIGVQIEGITIDDTSKTTNGRMAAGITCAITGNGTASDAPTTISKCVVNATINSSATNTAGGVVCRSFTKGTVIVDSCVFGGTITTAGGTVGGIIGSHLNERCTINIRNCVDMGTFKGTVSDAGGLMGYVNRNATVNIVNSYDYSYRPATISGANTGIEVAATNEKSVTLTIDDKSTAVQTDKAFTAPKRAVALTAGNPTAKIVADYSAIAAEVNAILAVATGNDANLTITTASENLTVRMKLTDPFGFMAITTAKDSGGNDVTLAEMDEMFVDYGFAMMASDTAMGARELVANAKISGKAYKAGSNEFYAAYTDLNAYELGQDVYFVAYTVDEFGTIVYSEVRVLNVAETVEDIVDMYTDDAGNVDESLSADVKAELEVYKAMLVYYNKYVAYFEELKNA